MTDPADQSAITLSDVIARGWRLTGYCEACRHGCLYNSPPPARWATVPIARLWAEGRLVCHRCRRPFCGVKVEGEGSMVNPSPTIAEFFVPGGWADPSRGENGPSS